MKVWVEGKGWTGWGRAQLLEQRGYVVQWQTLQDAPPVPEESRLPYKDDEP